MTDLLTADPKLVGVFANALVMGQGAAQALAENKAADRITLVSFDSDDKTVRMLSDGTIYALVVQNPFREGHDAVETALDVSQGKSVAANIDTGVTVITKANMTSDASKALLSPKVQLIPPRRIGKVLCHWGRRGVGRGAGVGDLAVANAGPAGAPDES